MRHRDRNIEERGPSPFNDARPDRTTTGENWGQTLVSLKNWGLTPVSSRNWGLTPVFAAAIAAAGILAGCAGLDPNNIIGRQAAFNDTAISSDVVPGVRGGPMDAAARERAFDFVWRTIEDRYYDPRLNGVDWAAMRAKYHPVAMAARDDEAFWDTLDRMTGELKDSHTRVESPRRVALRKRDETISLGFTFMPVDGKLAVTSITPDSDAWWAGVRPGMVLKTIDGEPADAAFARLLAETRLDSTERSRQMRTVRRLVTGDENTVARFTFQRADGSELEALVTRRKLSTRATSMHRVLPSGWGYLRFTQWTLGVIPRVNDGLDALRNTPGLIIDLRGNPGGSLHMVNAMLGRFFRERAQLGRILTRTGQPVSLLFGALEVIKLHTVVDGDPAAYKGPVVILVNAQSASASELFAATMQAAGRAVVVGQPSCGCLLGFLGYAAVPGGAELAYSEIGFVMSNGRRIEGEGVVPDKVVPLTLEDLVVSRDRTLEEAQHVLATMKKRAADPATSAAVPAGVDAGMQAGTP